MVLQAIRERLTGILAIFIFGILIIPFAFVGVNSYFSSDSVNSVARVNEADITTTQFTQSFQNYRRRMQSLLGANFDAEQFDQPIVRRQHLDNLINQELLSQVSLESGLSVDDESLAQAIRDIEAFQVDGVFNTEVYQSRLLGQGTTPQQFENDMRAQLILDQYPGAIASSAIATDHEFEQFIRLQEQQRTFKAIVVPAFPDDADGADPAEADDESADESIAETDSAEDPTAEVADETDTAEEQIAEAGTEDGTTLPPVEESAVVAWYEANQQDYRSEEQVLIEYVELDSADMAEEIQPDDEQLRARFETQKARFITPETRLASHILIEVSPDADEATVETARQAAADLTRRARAGAEFAELARENSQDAGSAELGGDLGWVEPGFMVQAFEDGLYELSMAEPISDPVQTGFGWHVILLRDVRPAEGMTFDEARDILVEEFVVEEQERRFLDVADRLVDLIYEDPTTLSSAAEVLDLEIQEAGPFGRAGGPGIAANTDIVKAAFSDLVLTQGVVSDPVDLDDNHIVMLRVKEHFPEAVRPLDEVRDQVVASIRLQRAMEQAQERARALLAQVESGAEMSVLAESEALELVESDGVTRNDGSVSADLLVKVFRLPLPGEENAQTAVVELNDGYAAVKLENVTDGEVSEDDLISAQNFRRRIANASASAEAIGFIQMLRSQSDIEVFEDRL